LIKKTIMMKRLFRTWRVDFCGLASNASTILFVVSASVLMRGLPGVDGCNATLNSRLARLAASRSLAYVIAHAAIINIGMVSVHKEVVMLYRYMLHDF
ncbi:hypothetical protein L9F63_018184, partial [Diploptera punctata]